MYKDSTSTEPYPLLAYNSPEGITIENNIAVIHEMQDGLRASLPDYLFAADTTVEVSAGDTLLVSLGMRRLVAPITLTLNFTDTAEVTSAEATLSGLIPAIHLPDGEPVAESTLRSDRGSRAWFDIEVRPDGMGIVMRLRTFGILPELHQLLHVTITLADGRTLAFESDLTGKLDDLAHLSPIALENTLDTAKPEEPEEPEEPDEPDPEPEPEPEPTPDPDPDWPPYRPPHDPEVPTETTGTISDWTTVEREEIDIY